MVSCINAMLKRHLLAIHLDVQLHGRVCHFGPPFSRVNTEVKKRYISKKRAFFKNKLFRYSNGVGDIGC